MKPKAPFRTTAKFLVCSFLYTSIGFGKVFKVNPGQSIQAAIDSAGTGDRIQVAAGTYAEQLIIEKNGTDLRGDNVNLVPGPTTRETYCNTGYNIGRTCGICIASRDATKLVTEASVTGFTIIGFEFGINIYNANNTQIVKNRIYDSTFQGVSSTNSSDTKIQSNEISGRAGLIPVCVSSFAYEGKRIKIAQNTFTSCGNAVLNTGSNADIENNQFQNGCVSIQTTNVPQVNAPASMISHNKIMASNPRCDELRYFVWGILITNKAPSVVDHNTIESQRDGYGGGLAIYYGGLSQSTITTNTLRNNDRNIIIAEFSAIPAVTKNTCTNPSTNCNY